MTIPTVFETCRPRSKGRDYRSRFRGGLGPSIVGKGNEEYLRIADAFGTTLDVLVKLS